MPSLHGLLHDQQSLTTTFHQHTITFVYRPSAYNADWSRALRRDEESTVIESLAQTLAQALVSWDVTEEDGTPVRPTAELLGSLGLGVMNAIDDAITRDLAPNRNRTPRR